MTKTFTISKNYTKFNIKKRIKFQYKLVILSENINLKKVCQRSKNFE